MLGPDRPLFHPSNAPKSATVSASQAKNLAVRQFVMRVGGLENARRALEMLATLSRAA